MVESSTGVVVKIDGSYHLKGEDLGYSIEFETEKEALAEKDKLLTLIPWQTCQVCEGRSENVKTYSNEVVVSEYLLELDAWRTYLSLPWFKRLFKDKPVLKYVKP